MLRRFNERTRARLLAPLPGAFGRPLRGHVHRFSPAPAFSQRPALCSQYSATTHPHHCVCRYSAVNRHTGQSLPSSIARRMGGVNRNRRAPRSKGRARVRIVAARAGRCFLAAGHLGSLSTPSFFGDPSIRFVMNCPTSWLTSSRLYGGLCLP